MIPEMSVRIKWKVPFSLPARIFGITSGVGQQRAKRFGRKESGEGAPRKGTNFLVSRFRARFLALSHAACACAQMRACKCIRNWPLLIGAFQDHCKQNNSDK